VEGFNFVFSLFALLLGLSLAEVLSGFAKALRHRRVVHLGWLTPMLALFVMLDLTSFWESGWAARKFLTPQYGMLLVGLVMCGLYYIAASIIFPGEFGEGGQQLHGNDFDEHYMEHRRQVLGAIMICDLLQLGPIAIIRFAEVPARFWVENAVQFGALLTGIASRNKRINIALLAVLILLYLFTAVMSFIQPPPL
jgi:hypothetical protein